MNADKFDSLVLRYGEIARNCESRVEMLIETYDLRDEIVSEHFHALVEIERLKKEVVRLHAELTVRIPEPIVSIDPKTGLAPCPWCGSDVEYTESYKGIYVYCKNDSCFATGPCDDPIGAKWNALHSIKREL